MNNITREELLENFVKIKHSEIHRNYKDQSDRVYSDRSSSEEARRARLSELALQRDSDIADIEEAIQYIEKANPIGLREVVTRMEFAREKSTRVIRYMHIVLDILEHYHD